MTSSSPPTHCESTSSPIGSRRPTTGIEALDFLFCREDYVKHDPRQQPRLIPLDIHLPRMNGLEVLREIRASNLTEDIPVVILTQSKEDANIIEPMWRPVPA